MPVRQVTCADDTARGLLAPAFVGQILLQLDDHSVWVGTPDLTFGSWGPYLGNLTQGYGSAAALDAGDEVGEVPVNRAIIQLVDNPGGVVSIDMALGKRFELLCTGTANSRTIGPILHPIDGEGVFLRISQSEDGDNAVLWDSEFEFIAGWDGTVSDEADARDITGLVPCVRAGKTDVIPAALGFGV